MIVGRGAKRVWVGGRNFKHSYPRNPPNLKTNAPHIRCPIFQLNTIRIFQFSTNKVLFQRTIKLYSTAQIEPINYSSTNINDKESKIEELEQKVENSEENNMIKNDNTSERQSQYSKELEHYEALIEKCPQKIDEIYDSMKKLYLPYRTFLFIMHRLIESGQMNKTITYLNNMQARGIPRTEHIYELIIRNSTLKHNLKLAHSVYKLMQSDTGVVVTPMILGCLLLAARHTKNSELAYQYYTDMKRYKIPLTQEIYCELILSFDKNGNNKSLLYVIYEEMEANIKPLTFSAFSALFSVVRVEEEELITFFYNEMRKHNIEFNLALANSLLMSAPAHIAHNIYLRLKELNVKPTSATFDRLIHGCCIAKNSDLARYYYKELKSFGLYPSKKFLLEFMATYCAKGEWKIANSVYKKCLGLGVIPNQAYYHQLIESCKKSGNSELAAEYLEDMIKNNITPNAETYAKMISVCIERLEVAKAKMYFQKVIDSNITPTFKVFHPLILVLNGSKNYTDAYRYYKLMSHYNIHPNAFTLQLLETIRKNGVPIV